jgi:hypothetical protein
MQGETTHGIALVRQGLDDYRVVEAELNLTYYLALLAQAYAKAVQGYEGLTVADEALTLLRNNGDRCYEAELFRLSSKPNPGNCAPPPAWRVCGSRKASARMHMTCSSRCHGRV